MVYMNLLELTVITEIVKLSFFYVTTFIDYRERFLSQKLLDLEVNVGCCHHGMLRCALKCYYIQNIRSKIACNNSASMPIDSSSRPSFTSWGKYFCDYTHVTHTSGASSISIPVHLLFWIPERVITECLSTIDADRMYFDWG